jgi:hypothetical protein
MKRSEVIAERRRLFAELKKAEAHVEHIGLDLRALQRQCSHPKLHKYSAMGEIGDYCPDCGYQT